MHIIGFTIKQANQVAPFTFNCLHTASRNFVEQRFPLRSATASFFRLIQDKTCAGTPAISEGMRMPAFERRTRNECPRRPITIAAIRQ